jgi:hypothetical protein
LKTIKGKDKVYEEKSKPKVLIRFSPVVEGKSPCGQVDLLLRARLLTLKTEDAYHGH